MFTTDHGNLNTGAGTSSNNGQNITPSQSAEFVLPLTATDARNFTATLQRAMNIIEKNDEKNDSEQKFLEAQKTIVDLKKLNEKLKLEALKVKNTFFANNLSKNATNDDGITCSTPAKAGTSSNNVPTLDASTIYNNSLEGNTCLLETKKSK